MYILPRFAERHFLLIYFTETTRIRADPVLMCKHHIYLLPLEEVLPFVGGVIVIVGVFPEQNEPSKLACGM